MKLKINFIEAFDFYHATINEAKQLFQDENTNCSAYTSLETRYKKLRNFCQRSFPKDKIRGFHFCLNKFNFKTGDIKYETNDLNKKTKKGYYYV